MAVSVSLMAIIISLHLIAFVLAVGSERRRSTAKVVPDKYDERTYCVYSTDASTVYGLTAFGLLLISQTVLNGVTKCLCFGRGLIGGGSTTCAVFFFIFSYHFIWSHHLLPPTTTTASGVNKKENLVSFLGAEACLLAGSAKNAYHTKYRGVFGGQDLSCATLRKGVFAAGAALSLLSLLGSILYYWAHSRADTGGWEKHRSEGLA
ncbi:hypothetical protein CK203_011750 [Vitis vinifera]|uniref:Fiber protein Fb34 n=1 Tax=Vitis vinifera TaxID=29760 RepID=A0A438JU93_VITVI|nr:hypothetical protein CK203_011750 [Vitis vinifera]